jgi:hypothetical protein
MNFIPMMSRRSLEALMTESQERKTDMENRFILNLTRMSGPNTNSVTPDCLLEFLSHLQNSSVDELQFIEEGYTSVIFEDDAFVNTYLRICSVEILIDKYEAAKKDNNTEFLDAFRILHRRARSQVLDEATKATLKDFIQQRRASNEMQLLGKIVSNFIEYLTRFKRPYMSNLLQSVLPFLTAERNIQAIRDNSRNPDEGVRFIASPAPNSENTGIIVPSVP